MNYLLIEVKGKNTKVFLEQIFNKKIDIYSIKYNKDKLIMKVSYTSYKKIKKLKTSCKIKIISYHGKKRIKDLLIKYKIHIIFFILSFIIFYILSSLTLFITIDSDNEKIKKIINKELKQEGISLFSFKKDYSSLSKIKTKIKERNLDKIEWIEISNRGVYTNVKVIERVNNKIKNNNELCDIVAKRNGYIRDIRSDQGELIKNIDDYVKKGEVIISGNIIRNDKVVDRVRASGKVYAEVWYIVKTNKNIKYNKLTPIDKKYFKIYLSILGKDYTIFKIKISSDKNYKKRIFNSKLFSIKYGYNNIYTKHIEKYDDRTLERILLTNSKTSIREKLKKDEYIISQKTLKKYKENDKMYIEVFFKVYQDIAEKNTIKDISIIEAKKEG